MLNGACNSLLAYLPSSTRQELEKELLGILSSYSAKNDSLLLLWCFGIVLLSECPDEVKKTAGRVLGYLQDSEDVTFEKKWSTSAGRKLFGSSECMLKTINFTSLSVIWACKGETFVSDSDAMEAIRIATRTLNCIPLSVRRSWWSSSHLGKSVPAKLLSKLLQKEMHPGVQFQVRKICHKNGYT